MTKPLTPEEYQHWKYIGHLDGDTIDRFAATLDFLFAANTHTIEALEQLRQKAEAFADESDNHDAIAALEHLERIARTAIEKAENKE